jgi:hypothetical protein
LSLGNEKLVLLAVLAAWLFGGARALPTRREWRALMPSLTLLIVALLAALFAPDYGDEALRFVGRLAAAVFAMLVILRVTAVDEKQLNGVLSAIVLGAGASGVVGFGEALGWRTLDPVLSLFKVAPTSVGGELRASGTFQYATIAAMYLEMATPLAIVLAATTQRYLLRVLASTIAAACTANVVLSLTRAGMLTLLVLFAVLLVLAWRRTDLRKLLMPTLASAAVLIGGVAILAHSSPVFDMRLVTESDADWYGAAYSVPVSLSVQADRLATVGLDVHNEGRIVWSSSGTRPFALGYRWLTGDGARVLDVAPGAVALPRDVAPGETIHLQTEVIVPSLPNGAYRLDWGMLQRDVLQFYERGWANAETLVTVDGAPSGAIVTSSPRDDGEAPWVVGRLELWSAALRLIQERPLLGVGPDNFRHLYGAHLGLETWDERVQANNLYLELLADLGLLGFAAFGWMIVPPLFGTVRAISRHTRSYRVLGISLGILAFLVHGLLDSFLAFTPTAMLLWVLLGLLVAETQKPHVSGR